MKKQSLLILILILTLAALFRFYNFTKLQYFSVDDDLVFVIIRKMAREKRLVLISPNEATGLTLGSFFHILSLPLFLLVNGNPILMGIFSSLLGVITAYFVYKSGGLINQRVGFIASFIYGTSFLISLFDRRFWALTPNTFLASLSFIALYKMAQKNKSWFYPFLFIFSSLFGWHSDLSLFIIPLTGFLTFLCFRINPFKKKNVPALLLLLFSLAPLILAEFKYGFINFKAIQIIQYRIGQKTESLSGFKTGLDYKLFLETILRILLTAPENVKNLFAYGASDYALPLHPFFSLLILALAIAGFLKKLVDQKEKNKKGLKIIILFFISFILGFIIYSLCFIGRFSQHYFTVVFPIFCLFLAAGLDFWLDYKAKFLIYLLLFLFFVFNFKALLKAEIKQPTLDKIKAIASIKKYIEQEKFAAYDFGFPEGGMHYLYVVNDLQPVKCATYDCWYWIYMSQGLFEVTPQSEWPDKVVVMLTNNEESIKEEHLIVQTKYKNITMFVFDNSRQWLTKEKLLLLFQNKI